jgi:hypothetical protein
VAGDNCQIFGQTLSVLDSIMLLIAIYYVFDLEYPAMYAQMLGIIQHWVVGDAKERMNKFDFKTTLLS